MQWIKTMRATRLHAVKKTHWSCAVKVREWHYWVYNVTAPAKCCLNEASGREILRYNTLSSHNILTTGQLFMFPCANLLVLFWEQEMTASMPLVWRHQGLTFELTIHVSLGVPCVLDKRVYVWYSMNRSNMKLMSWHHQELQLCIHTNSFVIF